MQHRRGVRSHNGHAHQRLANRQLPGLHTLTITPLAGEIGGRRSLNPPRIGSQQHIARLGQQLGSHQAVAWRQAHAQHSRSYQAHRAHFVFAKANRHPTGACQQQFALAAALPHPEQPVAFVHLHQGEYAGRRAGQVF